MNRSRQREILILFGLVVLGFVLGRYQTAARKTGRTDPISVAARTVIQPAASALNGAAVGLANLTQAVVQGGRQREENLRLKAIAISAENYQADVERLQSEIDELRKLGGWEASPGRSKTPAEVIGYFPAESRITLNAGTNKGVKRGMPVATFEGLVGRVETVDAGACQVLLITSGTPDSRMSAVVQGKVPASGMIRGDGAGSLILELADPRAPVEIGQIVTTSGFSDLIPRGIVIGKIVGLHEDAAMGKHSATVSPRVDLGSIREVLVIK